jgi:hypothetical protein
LLTEFLLIILLLAVVVAVVNNHFYQILSVSEKMKVMEKAFIIYLLRLRFTLIRISIEFVVFI